MLDPEPSYREVLRRNILRREAQLPPLNEENEHLDAYYAAWCQAWEIQKKPYADALEMIDTAVWNYHEAKGRVGRALRIAAHRDFQRIMRLELEAKGIEMPTPQRALENIRLWKEGQ